MLMLATDLDRTLFHNGVQEYDGSMPRLRGFLAAREDVMLVYVTGRNARETTEGVREYDAPPPCCAVCEVGTRIYRMTAGALLNDPAWDAQITARTRNWDPPAFRQALDAMPGLQIQPAEHQNPFKVSYFVDNPAPHDPRADAARARIGAICPDADIVYSVDETVGVGLLDVLPRAATKLAGLEYLRGQFGLTLDDVIYAGDSGNDLLPLTSGCRAILVRNATDEVRATAEEIMAEKKLADRLYCARGAPGLNGYYVSGIIEGLIHFGVMRASVE